MDRQCDPASPDVTVGPGAEVNTTHRSWNLLGTLGEANHAVIDPRGMISPRAGSWSLDWWVGADDRWHLPSRSVAVRQRLVDDSPVVETTVRVPGGEVVHRAWAVAAGEGVPVGGAVVVEIRNGSTVPVAVAFALRPFGPLGRSVIGRIDLDDTRITVDGHTALLLPRPPSRVAVGSAALGDSLGVVRSGAAVAAWPEGGVHCADGHGSAAVLFPLPHTATIRVLVPLAVPPTARRTLRRVAATDLVGSPAGAPDAERVVAGWEVQTRRCPRIELLEPRADEALRSARRSALLHAAGDDAVSWTDGLLGVFDSCSLIMALDEQGLHAEAAKLIMGLDDRIDVDGSFEQERHRPDAGAAWLVAVARHVELADDAALARVLVGDVAKIAHRVRRDIGSGRGARRVRSSDGPSWAQDPASIRVHDLIWTSQGLWAASYALRVAGQAAAAEEVDHLRSGLAAECAAAVERASETGTQAIAALTALVESGADDEHSRATLAALVGATVRVSHRGAVWQAAGAAGWSPRLSAAAGIARARLGDPEAIGSQRWFLEAGAPTWSWPDFVHPRTGDGCGGDGHSPTSTAAFLRLVRSMTVMEDASGLDALPVVPAQWLGQPLEVHDLPTRWGRLSFAIRWHGARPAVLWDLVPQADEGVVAAHGVGPVTLRFGGLDPAWSTTELRGEALLAAPDVDPDSSELGEPLEGESSGDPDSGIDGGSEPFAGRQLPVVPDVGDSFL
jgi:hypothetical protein